MTPVLLTYIYIYIYEYGKILGIASTKKNLWHPPQNLRKSNPSNPSNLQPWSFSMVMALSSRRSCTTTRTVLSCAVLNSVEPLQHQFVVAITMYRFHVCRELNYDAYYMAVTPWLFQIRLLAFCCFPDT